MSENTNYFNDSSEELNDKIKDLNWSLNNVPHGIERRKQIEVQIGVIATELWCRHRDEQLVAVED